MNGSSPFPFVSVIGYLLDASYYKNYGSSPFPFVPVTAYYLKLFTVRIREMIL